MTAQGRNHSIAKQLRRYFVASNDELDRKEEYEDKKSFLEYLCWFTDPVRMRAIKDQEKATVVNPNFARQVAELNAKTEDEEIGGIEIGGTN